MQARLLDKFWDIFVSLLGLYLNKKVFQQTYNMIVSYGFRILFVISNISIFHTFKLIHVHILYIQVDPCIYLKLILII